MFKRNQNHALPHDAQNAAQESTYVYKSPTLSGGQTREIEKSFARLFASDDGLRVLAHLQSITFERALGPTSSDEQLRYIEGQRSLVASILRLIDRGRTAR